MHRSELTDEERAIAAAERQAQLLAAARQIRSWIDTQRLAWPDLPDRPLVEASVRSTAAPAAPDRRRTRARAVSAPGFGARLMALVSVVAASLARGSAALGDFAAELLTRGAAALRTLAAFIGRQAARWPARAAGRWAVGLAVVGAVVIAAGVVGASGLAHWKAWRKAPTFGTAIIESAPTQAYISVDGTPVGATPMSAELAPGRHRIEFRRQNGKRTIDIDVAPGRRTEAKLDWNDVPTGSLQTESTPPGARIIVDGQDRGVTPLTIEGVPIGSHVVDLESRHGSLRKIVSVEDSRTAVVSEGIFPGWIRVSSPIGVEVLEAGRAVALDEQNRALIRAGAHDLRFQNRSLGFSEQRHVEVKPGETTAISLEPKPSALTVTATEPADVTIDGDSAGGTPLNNYPIALGTHDIIVRNPAGASRYMAVTVTTSPASVNADFSKP